MVLIENVQMYGLDGAGHAPSIPIYQVLPCLVIGMGPMPAIVELWGNDVQNSSSSSSSSFDRSTPITQKQSNIKT